MIIIIIVIVITIVAIASTIAFRSCMLFNELPLNCPEARQYLLSYSIARVMRVHFLLGSLSSLC